jgi:hypothetical protein
MTIGDPLEWFKLLGSIGGIASSGFLIYDRLWRLRPTVYLQPDDYNVHLRIKNNANEALVIDKIDISPKVLSIAIKDEEGSLLSTVEAVADQYYPEEGRTFCVLSPLEERSFRLVALTACDALKDSDRIRIRCAWRTTRAQWPFIRTVTVATTRGDFGSFLIASRPRSASPKRRRGIVD